MEDIGPTDGLNRAADMINLALDATPEDYPNRAMYLNVLGLLLSRRFERTGLTDDLNCAVEMAEMAVNATAQDHPDRVMYLSNLGIMLGNRFERTGSMDDLSRAVEVANMAVNVTPQDHPDRAVSLNNLANMLGRRFERTGSTDDLNRAVKMANMAVDATPQDHPDRAGSLSNLGTWLGRRFERTGSTDDLNRAVETANMAVNALPQGHLDRAGVLNNLGIILGNRFQRTGSMDDLNRAVEVTDMAVDATPHDHPDQAMYLSNLGNWLGNRFKRTGSMDDLNRAVKVADMAVDASPLNHPDRAGRLNTLGTWLSRRFERTGSMDDLNRAVKVADIAIDATPQDHPDQAMYLRNLGNMLGSQFERTGSMDDLNRAVEVADMAVNATPQGHSNRAGSLDTLGTWLSRRFERTGSMDDVNRAVKMAKMAVDATAQDHPDRVMYLSNLGNMLGRRSERTRSIDDLNRAVEVADIAVNVTPQDHPDRAVSLNTLGTWLGRRFERTGLMDDLNRAVEIADMAVNATPQDHPDRAGSLSNLGNWLGRRFQRTGSTDDLNRAVDMADMAVDATPQDHPNRAIYFNSLGTWLGSRFERTGSINDLNRSLSCYVDGWVCHTSPPSIRISSARRAAIILASRLRWEEASIFVEGAVQLLSFVSPRLLDNSDKQHALEKFAGLASMAAAVYLEADKDVHYALEVLELGRCVIAGLLLDMRTDVTELKEQHPELAAQFISLRNELDSPSDTTASIGGAAASWKSQASRRIEADQAFNKLVSEIRSQSGFGRFLLPPTREELMAAADQGPIVIVNVSPYRCDAFIVERDRIRVIPLPELEEGELVRIVQQKSVGSATTLEWLWKVVARPVLDALSYQHSSSNDNLPRVWWIPTGALSHFPIHAAGFHTKGYTGAVLDRVMSSYTSTIKALVHGRQKNIYKAAGSSLEHAVLIAMERTLHQTPLPFVTTEVHMLDGLCPSLHLRPVRPARRREEVLSHLQTCKIFHFAGHGTSDPQDPSRSCLLLEDWQSSPLTVEDLRDRGTQNSFPFLGYLSACSTGANKVDTLVDEGIHLVSAFQLAGFRHVIGTLWEVSDSCCVDVARVVYETLRDEGMTDIAVCRGLHRAVKALRDNQISIRREGRDGTLVDEAGENVAHQPLYWVPYVHFGV